MRRQSWAGAATLILFSGYCASVRAAHPATAADPAQPALQTIVITATPPPVQSLIDRKVYSIRSDLQSTSGTAADVLRAVPSVEVDADGNVSLRGDTHVTILIDGKPSAQLSGPLAGDGLLQFPASDIEKIEIMTTPPVQYAAEGSAGVINIITKKRHKAGPSGTAQASVGNRDRYVLSVSGNYDSDALDLSGGLGFRRDTRERLVHSTLVAADPISQAVVVSHENLDEQVYRRLPSAKAGITYRFNERQSLDLSLSHRERSGNRFFDQHNDSMALNGPLLVVTDRHSDGHEWSLDGEQTLRFNQLLRHPEETLDVTLHRSVEREREHYAYRNSATLPVASASVDHLNLSLDLWTTEFSADYARTLDKERKVKLGYDVEENNNAFDNSGDTVDPVTGLPVVNPSVTNDFRYRQRIQAAYGSYQSSVGSWTLLVGARVEHTAIDTRQITGNITGQQRYTQVYPNLHLERALSETSTLSLSLGRRVSRPDAEALNPFEDHQDTHHLRAGNPNLLPQDTRSLELAYSRDSGKLHYALTPYLRRTYNSVTDVTQLVSSDVVLTTKANLPKSTAGGLEFTTNGKFTPRLSYALSGDLFYIQIDATALAATGARSTTGLNAKASLDYHPTGVDTMQITLSRSDKRLTAQGTVSAITLVGVGVRHQIRPKLSTVFTVSDLLNGQTFQRSVSAPGIVDIYQRTQVGRLAYLGIVYALGAPEKSKATDFEYDQ